MSIWTRHLRRPDNIEGLYESTPSLEDFELAEIAFDRDQNTCLLRGALAEFADFPKSEWADDANRVGIRLWLEKLVGFEIDGWSFENIVDLQITGSDGIIGYRVSATGDEVQFEATCNSLHVEGIYAYHSTDG